MLFLCYSIFAYSIFEFRGKCRPRYICAYVRIFVRLCLVCVRDARITCNVPHSTCDAKRTLLIPIHIAECRTHTAVVFVCWYAKASVYCFSNFFSRISPPSPSSSAFFSVRILTRIIESTYVLLLPRFGMA